MSPRERVRRVVAAVALVAFGGIAAQADADPQPAATILHEFVPPDATEDVSFAATTLEGDLACRDPDAERG